MQDERHQKTKMQRQIERTFINKTDYDEKKMMRFSYQLNVFTQNLLTIIINCSTKIKLEENSTKELQDSSPPVDLQDFVSRIFIVFKKQ